MSAENVDMCGKMSMMQEQMNSFATENEELKKFKADLDQKQFNFEVDTTIKEAESFIPYEELNVLREQSKEFSLENIDGWKNAVKATAFSYSKNEKPKDEEFRFALPFTKTEKKHNSLWD
jgi:hypothetical protein